MHLQRSAFPNRFTEAIFSSSPIGFTFSVARPEIFFDISRAGASHRDSASNELDGSKAPDASKAPSRFYRSSAEQTRRPVYAANPTKPRDHHRAGANHADSAPDRFRAEPEPIAPASAADLRAAADHATSIEQNRHLSTNMGIVNQLRTNMVQYRSRLTTGRPKG